MTQSIITPDFRRLDMTEDLNKILRRIRGDNAAFSTEVAAAANPLCFSDDQTRPLYWKIFSEIATSSLVRIAGETPSGDFDFFRTFLMTTGYDDISALVRRDRHIWNMCLHIFRNDGCWVACDVVIEGIIFVGSTTGTNPLKRIGIHREEGTSRNSINTDLAAGLLKSPPNPVNVFFRNDRVLDVSHSMVKLSALMQNIVTHSNINIYFDKLTTFLDVDFLILNPSMRNAIFYAPPTYQEVWSSGGSVVEALYLPRSGTDSIKDCCKTLYEILAPFRSVAAPENGQDNIFIIFLSLELEKRVWIEQIQTIIKLLHDVINQYKEKTVTLIINGMTGSIFKTENKKYSSIYNAEVEFIKLLELEFGSNIAIQHLFGLSLDRKISRISTANFFIAPAGTAAVTALLADVPGVCYSHKDMKKTFEAHLSAFDNVTHICATTACTSDISPGLMNYSWAKSDGQSYSIASEQFLSELMPILSAVIENASGVSQDQKS